MAVLEFRNEETDMQASRGASGVECSRIGEFYGVVVLAARRSRASLQRTMAERTGARHVPRTRMTLAASKSVHSHDESLFDASFVHDRCGGDERTSTIRDGAGHHGTAY